MNDLIKNGWFENQFFTPWHSSAYPELPLMPHYQGSCFSVLINTGEQIQQNIAVSRDRPFIVSWEFRARLIEDSGSEGAKIMTGLFSSTDLPAHLTTISNRDWQTYAHTGELPIHSRDGWLGVVFSDPLSLPDPGRRTRVQMTGFRLWTDYTPS